MNPVYQAVILLTYLTQYYHDTTTTISIEKTL